MTKYDKPLQSDSPEFDEAMTPRPDDPDRNDESPRTSTSRETRNIIRHGSESDPTNRTE